MNRDHAIGAIERVLQERDDPAVALHAISHLNAADSAHTDARACEITNELMLVLSQTSSNALVLKTANAFVSEYKAYVQAKFRPKARR